MIPTDSGFWVAMGDQRDTDHAAAQIAMSRWAVESFVTTWPVITEVSHVLRQRAGLKPVLDFMDRVSRGGLVVSELSLRSVARMSALMHRYRDQPMDLADASLIVLAEQLGEARILSTDRRDFEIYRWSGDHSFANLL